MSKMIDPEGKTKVECSLTAAEGDEKSIRDACLMLPRDARAPVARVDNMVPRSIAQLG